MTIDEKTFDIVSAQDYYPYGEVLRSYVTGSNVNDKYKFTEKERDTETNYDYFGARYYDSDLARWLSVDPLATKFPSWSPYNYCLNNPLIYFDPDGRAIKDKKTGQYISGNEAVNLLLPVLQNSARGENQSIPFEQVDNSWEDLYDNVCRGGTYEQGSFVGTGALSIGDKIFGGRPLGDKTGRSIKSQRKFWVDTRDTDTRLTYQNAQQIGNFKNGEAMFGVFFGIGKAGKTLVIAKFNYKELKTFVESAGGKISNNNGKITIYFSGGNDEKEKEVEN